MDIVAMSLHKAGVFDEFNEKEALSINEPSTGHNTPSSIPLMPGQECQIPALESTPRRGEVTKIEQKGDNFIETPLTDCMDNHPQCFTNISTDFEKQNDTKAVPIKQETVAQASNMYPAVFFTPQTKWESGKERKTLTPEEKKVRKNEKDRRYRLRIKEEGRSVQGKVVKLEEEKKRVEEKYENAMNHHAFEKEQFKNEQDALRHELDTERLLRCIQDVWIQHFLTKAEQRGESIDVQLEPLDESNEIFLVWPAPQ